MIPGKICQYHPPRVRDSQSPKDFPRYDILDPYQPRPRLIGIVDDTLVHVDLFPTELGEV